MDQLTKMSTSARLVIGAASYLLAAEVEERRLKDKAQAHHNNVCPRNAVFPGNEHVDSVTEPSEETEGGEDQG